jgi:DNA-binding SARP family transcriptional activator
VDAVPPVRVSLLNGFAVEFDGDDRLAAGADLPHSLQRLVAHLGVAGRPTRAVIAGQLWPDVPDKQAQASLRSALWRLQKTLPGLVDVCGGTMRLAEGVWVDVRELTEWALRVLGPRTDVDALVTPPFAMYGELLPGWYDEWVLVARERLRQLRMHALERLAEALSQAGRYGEAVQAAYAAVRAEPLRESAHRTLVAVYLSEGNAIEAIRAYESFRCLLASELGVVPTGQMEELFRRACAP